MRACVLVLIVLSAGLALSVVASAATPVQLPGKVHVQVAPVSETVGTEDEVCHEETCTATNTGAEAEVSWGGAEARADRPDCVTATSDAAAPDCEPSTPTVRADAPDAALHVNAVDGPREGASVSDGPSTAGLFSSMVAPASSVGGWGLAAAGIGAGSLLLLPMARRLFLVLGAPFATRLLNDRLLEDDTRRAIYTTVRDEPGINLKALADRLDVAWGTLLHHVRKLESAHLIVSQRYGKYRRYFLNGGTFSRDERAQMAALASPSTARVAEAILDHPGETQREIGSRLGVSPSTVLWHAKRLEEVELVDCVRDGRCVKYYPRNAPQARQLAATVA